MSMRTLLLCLMMLSLFALSQCQENIHYRQRLTIVLDTPDGPKISHGVQKVNVTHTKWGPAEAVGATTDIIGETFAVEVTPGRYMFPLLNTIPLAAGVIYPKLSYVEAAKNLSEKSGFMVAELKRDQYPTFVTFENPSRLEGAIIVKPGRLGEVFGPPLSIRSITLTTTDERITLRDYTRVVPSVMYLDKSYWDTKRPFIRTDFHRSVPPSWMPDFLRDLLTG
jgi:hypothetical protein